MAQTRTRLLLNLLLLHLPVAVLVLSMTTTTPLMRMAARHPPAPVLSLKQRLLQGEKSYGPLILSDSSVVAEILALAGYSHIVVDHEHSPTDVRSGQQLLQAIESTYDSLAAATNNDSGVLRPRTEAIVRVPSPNDPVYMKKVLDTLRLPAGVLVPMVDDAATARAVVESTRYPRQVMAEASASSPGDDAAPVPGSLMVGGGGIRGCAASYVRASAWGRIDNEAYLKQCDEDLLVMVQVETQKGVESIDEIAKVPGIDAIFLGPLDLSCSIGKMGRYTDPQVQDIIATAERKIRESGCILAGFRQPGRDLKEMFEESGYGLICGSVDVGLLREAARQDLQAARDALSSIKSRPISSSLYNGIDDDDDGTRK